MSTDYELTIPEDAASVLVFGGSFDPPHNAHVALPPIVRDAVGCDWLLYVPAARSPLKETQSGATGEERLAMVRRAVAGIDRASVTDLELQRGGVSYTVDTLRQLREALGFDVTLRLLIGADQALDFHRWREAETILKIGEPVVMMRGDREEELDSFCSLMASRWPEDEAARWRDRVVRTPLLDVSSTQVRALLLERWPKSRGLRRMMPRSVLKYIRQRGLYREREAAGA